MRLPQLLLESPFFAFTSAKELVGALGDYVSEQEVAEIERLATLRLPPMTSVLTCSTMLGVNPGLLWSLLNKPNRHYRFFQIPKGRGFRSIQAPRVALKVIQKWLSYHLQNIYEPPAHVYGFVQGKSHIQAAEQHVRAQWVFSVDIADFFPSTDMLTVVRALEGVGYSTNGAQLVARLCCLNSRLAQGAPSSPVISNLAFANLDSSLSDLARRYGIRLSRYADDIVFSGFDHFPESLPDEVRALFVGKPWRLAEKKIEFSQLPERLKVHGLLVHGERVRLTKGYRNKLRAYRHLWNSNQIQRDDMRRISGHLQYGAQIGAARIEGGDS